MSTLVFLYISFTLYAMHALHPFFCLRNLTHSWVHGGLQKGRLEVSLEKTLQVWSDKAQNEKLHKLSRSLLPTSGQYTDPRKSARISTYLCQSVQASVDLRRSAARSTFMASHLSRIYFSDALYKVCICTYIYMCHVCTYCYIYTHMYNIMYIHMDI